MSYDTLQQFKKMLGNLDGCLAKASLHAQAHKVDPKVYANLRLAIDQFPLSRQVQVACDTAKLATQRLTGKEAPPMADTEQTLDELQARIQVTLGYLNTITAKDFEGADARSITTPRWEGKTLSGADYLREHAVPNFYFHVATAYAILRHNGVPLGKSDYLGPLPFRAP